MDVEVGREDGGEGREGGSPLKGEWSCVAGLIRWCWVSKMCTMHAPDSQVMANTAGLPKAQCVKLDGWNEPWRGLVLLHASWNGCQKPCCNRFLTVFEGFKN